jgi:predicted MPP superfamily phosphohydrolase
MADLEVPRPEGKQDPPRARERLGRVLRAALVLVVLSVVGYLGGVAATSLWPITAQTQNFQAQIRVSPSLLKSSTVHNPTVFGDIDLVFDGPVPAPGIEARVQVKEEITDLFTTGRIDVDSLAPESAELREAMEGGLRELAWKFGAGVVGTDLVVVGLWLFGRPRRPWRPALASVAGAAVLATAVPGTGALLTYRTDHFVSFTTTSLLGTVRSNSGMFTDIRGQAQQATPYVQNLLALSNALQAEFLPVDVTGPTAARFLLVADIHGMNYYPLMEQVIEAEGITAVIQAGDLLNFGRTAEGEMSGIFEAIEGLGVPYVFVGGNHDAVSPTDEALLRRLEQIPNVVLLEPTAGQYVEASVHGVRISGLNDARHFAEVNDDFGGQQREAARRYAQAVAGHPLPDILVSHQPYAVDPLETGAVKVSGHMHDVQLDGNHIQVGTFTGGGLVNHFQVPAEEDDDTAGELVGQPYAFDILSFGQDCSVQSLTRYSYRNLVSGRPQYDGVSVVNGARIAPAPDLEEGEEARSCGPDLSATSEIIEPAEDDGEDADEGDEDADEGDGPGPRSPDVAAAKPPQQSSPVTNFEEA